MSRSSSNYATNNSSLNRIRNAVSVNSQQVLPNPASNGVVVRRQEAVTQLPHYSTAVVKKRRSNPNLDRNSGRRSSSEDLQVAGELHLEGYHHQYRNGYPTSSSQAPTVRVSNSGSDVSLLPEQKSIPKSAQQQRLMASYERISSSPKMTRKPMRGIVPGASATSTSSQSSSNYQQSSTTRRSEPNLLDRTVYDPSVYPESIQPYMSSGDAKAQMKSYKYTPYTDGGKSNGQGSANHASKKSLPDNSWWPESDYF